MFREPGALSRSPHELREAAKRRGLQIRRRRHALGAVAATLAIVAAAATAVVFLPGASHRRTVVELSPSGGLNGQRILALTLAGALEELSYPSGSVIRQITPPASTVRCYGASPPCMADTPPESQASLAYDSQTQTAFLSLNGEEIDAFPLDGEPPRYVTNGDQPAVSPDGTMLAFHPSAAELGKGTVTVRNLVTGQERNWVIPAATVAAEAGLPYPTTAEDTQAGTLSWAPDGTHLAVTMYMAFGLNAGNSEGTTFDEVLLLDTTKPVSADNPVLVGPPATSMTGLRDQSDGKGWADATWLEGGQQLLALHLTGGMNAGFCMQPQAHPLEVTVTPVSGSTWTDQALSQPPENLTIPQPGVPYTCGAQLLGVNPSGIAIFIGSGPPRLEAWNTRNGSSSVQLVGRNIGAATWESASP